MEQYLLALDAGIDSARVATRARQAQAEISAAEAVLAGHTRTSAPPPTADFIGETLAAFGDLPTLLSEVANAEDRHDLYQAVGLDLTYLREGTAHIVEASVALPMDLLCVEGGT